MTTSINIQQNQNITTIYIDDFKDILEEMESI